MCDIHILPSCDHFSVVCLGPDPTKAGHFHTRLNIRLQPLRILTIGVVFKNKFVIAFLFIHAAADVKYPVLVVLLDHDTLGSVILGNHDIFHRELWIVTESAHPNAFIVLFPETQKEIRTVEKVDSCKLWHNLLEMATFNITQVGWQPFRILPHKIIEVCCSTLLILAASLT